MQELSPSAPLLKSYLTRMIDWDTFTSGYHKEMKSNPVSQQAIHALHYYVMRRMEKIVIDTY